MTAPQRPMRLLRRAISPAALSWSGFVLALIHLFRQLGCADSDVLGLWLNSDTLWQANVFTDLFRDHYTLSGWVFSIAPCWVPDLVFTGAFWLLTGNVILATLLAGFIQIALLIGGFHLCRKALALNAAQLQNTVLIAMGVAVTLYVTEHPGRIYPGLYQFFLPQTHVGSLIVVLYALGLNLIWIRRQHESGRVPRSLWIAYGSVCLLGGMSNVLFFVHMLLPVSLALLAAWFFGMLALKEIYQPVCVGWLAAAVGGLLNRALFHVSDVSTQSRISLDRMLLSLDVFLRGLTTKVLAGDILHWVAIVWAVVCAGYVLFILRQMARGAGDRVGLSRILAWVFFLSCLLAGTCSMAAMIVGGSNGLADFKDYIWTMHYFHPAFLLPVFGLALLLAWGIAVVCSPRVCRVVAIVAAALGVLAPVLKIAAGPSPRRDLASYRPPLVRFMDELARQENLRYGYAGYWQARMITLLSTRGLRAYAVDGVLNPLLWVSNREWYRESLEDRKRRPRIDFVVLDDPGWKISREGAVRVLGEPTREVRYDNTRVLIYSPPAAQSNR